MPPLLEISDLAVAFGTEQGEVEALSGVSFSIEEGESFGVVGESGSGKSLTALSVLGLIPDPPGRVTRGEIRFAGQVLDANAQRRLRGRDIAMIFQEPMSALNPVFTVGEQVAEGLRVHEKLSRRAARDRAAQLLGHVGLRNILTNCRAACASG
jgi:oligopeptide transport system ATP-binding protein